MAYLNLPAAYYAEGKRWGSFVSWNMQRRDEATHEELLDEARWLADSNGKSSLILSNHALGVLPATDVVLLATFEYSVVNDEDYYLYLVPADP